MDNQIYIKTINSLIAKVDGYLAQPGLGKQRMIELEKEVDEFRVEVWKSDMPVETRELMKDIRFDHFFLKRKKMPWIRSLFFWQYIMVEKAVAKPEEHRDMTFALRSLRNQLEELLNDFRFF